MRAVLLGTGAADIRAPWQCKCKNCRAVALIGGQSARTYSCLLLNDDLLVDCGATAPTQFKTFAPQARVKHLLITHPDMDHLNATAIAQIPKDPSRPDLPVWGSLSVITTLRYEAQCHLDLHPLAPLGKVQVGDWEVVPLPARHRGTAGDSLIFLLSRGGRSLLYAADTGPLLDEALAGLQGWKLSAVVAEATFGLDTAGIPDLGTAHMNFPMVSEMRRDFLRRGLVTDSTPFIATHLSLHHCPPHEQSAAWLAREGVTLGYDGMKFEW